MGNLFRTDAGAEKYRAYRANGALERGCALCDAEPVQVFEYWKIIPNNFPYDRIAEKHEMIVPLRHVTEGDLNDEEKAEYPQIKNSQLQEYDYVIEVMQDKKTIPDHFHLHLIVGKR